VTVGSGETAVPARRRRRRANRRGSGGRTERATLALALAPLPAEPPRPDLPDLDDDAPHADRVLPVFAHASEGEMARILDFYRIRWEYEPHTFPILWTLEGDVAESFSPDFWLPDLELYLEMTTLRQKLVRKKNRKLRRIRELYPDLRIKLFYARDFRALMLKFGRLAMVDALSGSSGQVVPDRSAEGGSVAAADLAIEASAADDPEVAE
jgi:hypoxanthine phosphoribosyltransferase